MTRFQRIIPSLVLAAFAASCGPAAGGPPQDPNPLADASWDDDRAEVSVYRGTVSRYGHDRPARVQLVVVKEDLVRSTRVKSEAGPAPGRTVQAIKMNLIWHFTTGTYDYHQMATVHFDRAGGGALQETMSSTEACGITFVRIAPGPRGGWTHHAHSYWDGEADREVPIPGEGALFLLDGAPVWLRRFAAAARPFERRVRLLPSQIAGRSPIDAARPVDAVVRLVGEESLTVPAGRFRAKRLAIGHGGRSDVYWFDAAAPHALLRMEDGLGRSIELVKTQRLDYWNHTSPGDERLLE